VRGLVPLPFEHPYRKGEFLEAADQQRRDFGFQRVSVKAGGDISLVFGHRAALHELALHAKQRLEFEVAAAQFRRRVLDVEELRDEGIEMRADRDQQVRFFLVGQRLRVRPGGHEAVAEAGVGGTQVLEEDAIEAAKALGVVEVREPEPECKVEFRGGQVWLHLGRRFGDRCSLLVYPTGRDQGTTVA